jgi:hypothetical protein
MPQTGSIRKETGSRNDTRRFRGSITLITDALSVSGGQVNIMNLRSRYL